MTSTTSVSATAPGRVNLIGEHTDYNGGLCLPVAVSLSTTATATARSDDRVRLTSSATGAWTGSLHDIDARRVTGWAAYVAGVLWALRRAGWPVPGLDLAISTDLPLGGGLSSSAALECSVATAVAGLLDRPMDDAGRRELAELCRVAETQYVGAPTGGMDQLTSMCGRADTALLLDFADPSSTRVEEIMLPLAEAGLTLLVTDTGVRHVLADGDGGYAQRREECRRAAADPGTSDPTLQARARHVRTENERVRAAVRAIEAGDWCRLGALMSASHASLRDDFEVSVPALDVAVTAAMQAGALGARLTGGGFGGCTVALTPADRVGAVRQGIDAAYAAAGHPRPAHHEVRAAAGARLAT